ncbi:MAG: 3',5'-cyclic-AMP phosphodiesterase [Halopseudomonas yangmingensis]
MSGAPLSQYEPLTLIQLTDSHLYSTPGADLLGMDTCASLRAVVGLVREQQPQVDRILATGDIAQDATEQAYARFLQEVAVLGAPCRWLAGNHDDARLMQRLPDAGALWPAWEDLGNWRLVLLDTSIPGAVPGLLQPDQLERLERALATAGERHVLVMLHHHPVVIGSDWMEPIGLLNRDDFWTRIDASNQVRAVLWGHVHQEHDSLRGNVRLLASPSTCVQFAAHSHDFATDTLSPGYRWLRLHPDGRIETAVERLPEGLFIADPDATGY